MRYINMPKIAIAVVLVIAIATSMWFAVPTQAIDMTFPGLPASGILGSTYSFQLKVDIADSELMPIQSISLYIYKADARVTYEATCTDLPLATTASPYTSITATGTSALLVQSVLPLVRPAGFLITAMATPYGKGLLTPLATDMAMEAGHHQ